MPFRHKGGPRHCCQYLLSKVPPPPPPAIHLDVCCIDDVIAFLRLEPEVVLTGDVFIRVISTKHHTGAATSNSEALCGLGFHCSLIGADPLWHLGRKELDNTHKEKALKTFSENFSLTLAFGSEAEEESGGSGGESGSGSGSSSGAAYEGAADTSCDPGRHALKGHALAAFTKNKANSKGGSSTGGAEDLTNAEQLALFEKVKAGADVDDALAEIKKGMGEVDVDGGGRRQRSSTFSTLGLNI